MSRAMRGRGKGGGGGCRGHSLHKQRTAAIATAISAFDSMSGYLLLVLPQGPKPKLRQFWYLGKRRAEYEAMRWRRCGASTWVVRGESRAAEAQP